MSFQTLPLTDAHLHLTAHRARDAQPEMNAAAVVRYCLGLGFRGLGLVEHLTATAKHPLACLQALVQDVQALPRSMDLDIRVGVELDIVDGRGALDCLADTEGLNLDFLIASVHGHVLKTLPPQAGFEACIRQETDWMVAALTGPARFALLGHPWAMSRRAGAGRFAAISRDCRECVIEALAASGRAYNTTHRDLADVLTPEFEMFVRRLLQAGVKIAVGSDAHALPTIARAADLTAWLESLGMRPNQLWWPADL